jgi:hypothetical protein
MHDSNVGKPTHEAATICAPFTRSTRDHGTAWRDRVRSLRCGEQFSIMAFAQTSARLRSMSRSATLEIMRHVATRSGGTFDIGRQTRWSHVRQIRVQPAMRWRRLSDLFNSVEQGTLHARLAIVNKASRRPGGRSSQYAPGSRQDRLLAGASSVR